MEKTNRYVEAEGKRERGIYYVGTTTELVEMRNKTRDEQKQKEVKRQTDREERSTNRDIQS